MDKFERRFNELTGRKANPKELEALRRIKDTMRLSDNDAVWWLIIFFQSLFTSFASTASRIEKATERIEKAIEQTSAKADKLMEGERSAGRPARVDPDVKPVSNFQVAALLLFVFVFVGGALALYGWGRESAIGQVRGYNPQVAARIFDVVECGQR